MEIGHLDKGQEDKKNDVKAKQRPGKSYYKKKKEFCKFCKKLKTNIARHFELTHKDAPEVCRFLKLTKKSLERKYLLSKLRNEGNFYFNSQNKEAPILSRQKNDAKTSHAGHYLPCPNCKVTIAKTSLSRHYQVCVENASTGTRSIVRESRSLVTNIHNVANEVMRMQIIPSMQRDAIFQILIQDRLIMLFGNHFAQKYKKLRQYIIRNQLRTLARFSKILQKINPKIKELEELFVPKNFDYAMTAVREIVGYKQERYGKPKLALTMSNNLITCCNILIANHIKEEKPDRQRQVENFLHLLRTETPGLVNKPAHDDLCEARRKKLLKTAVRLPLTEDIAQFQSYLLQQGSAAYDQLTKHEKFCFENWKTLNEVTLLYLVSFNRRRAGEARNILLEDFENVHSLSHTPLAESFDELEPGEKSTAKSFHKLVIRGKLDRHVDLLLPERLKQFLDCLCSRRAEANIPEENAFLFAMPGKLSGQRDKILDTCSLMRKHTRNAGLKEPEKVRTSLLRKHLATKVSMLNLRDSDQETIQNFMGHDGHVHRNWYRQQVVKRDLMMTDILTTSGNDRPQQKRVGEQKQKKTKMKLPRNKSRKEIITRYRFELVAWITSERLAIKKCWRQHIRNGTLPSDDQIKESMSQFHGLANASFARIKSHVINEIKRRKSLLSRF